jgi:hypothetical protein
MLNIIRSILTGIGALTVIVGLLYLAGLRITGPGGRPLVSADTAGSGKHHPGWRRGEAPSGDASAYGTGQGGQMAQAGQPGPGSGQGGGGGNGPGRRQSQGGGGNGQRGSQPGFGPTGGILLPIKVGSTATPVAVAGKEKASFVGKDLTDHVEDTVIATAEGPRKGWSVAKTLTYLGIDSYKTATLIDTGGNKVVVSFQQLQDTRTIPLFTYDENGRLMVVSGPKVRGTNRGKVTLEEVKQIVAGRTDLLHVNDIRKIDING